MDAFRRLGAMQISAALQEATSDPFPASYTERVRKIGVVNAKNKRITDVIAKLLDGPAWLRRYVIEKVIVEGYRFDQLMRDDEALEDFIRKAAIGVWHATCTCRMGAEDDPMAVTDNQGRVRGVGGLRVVDASLFPVRAVRQYQLSDLDDRRKDRRRDGGAVISATSLRGAKRRSNLDGRSRASRDCVASLAMTVLRAAGDRRQGEAATCVLGFSTIWTTAGSR